MWPGLVSWPIRFLLIHWVSVRREEHNSWQEYQSDKLCQLGQNWVFIGLTLRGFRINIGRFVIWNKGPINGTLETYLVNKKCPISFISLWCINKTKFWFWSPKIIFEFASSSTIDGWGWGPIYNGGFKGGFSSKRGTFLLVNWVLILFVWRQSQTDSPSSPKKIKAT